ncbi:hypothetical protein AUK40_06535 [Candidatus Wirthbacteria bacterium CG2_30_54_11]|uniref:Capsule synthesis protein CapA domain-containing protein n=1 Tax=Candidatus Wirthbacteria bacterium CG2_30_54_11 TaxID=1817892 RepID=A0A1J5ICP2_9BACT|nr:MAG: hypothetical protein AUK40_06535 [Candidatus Wirthbacteria bacterium CG2_30_54_11]
MKPIPSPLATVPKTSLAKRKLAFEGGQPRRRYRRSSSIRNWWILGTVCLGALVLVAFLPRPLSSYVTNLPFNTKRLTIYTSSRAQIESLLSSFGGRVDDYRLAWGALPPDAEAPASPSISIALTYAPQPPAAETERTTLYECGGTLVAAVNFTNPLTSVTREQLLGVLSGTITSWDDLGWPQDTMKTFLPDPASSLPGSQTLSETLPPNAQWYSDLNAMLAILRDDPSAIALLPATSLYANPDIRHLSIDGISPLKSKVDMATYPLVKTITLKLPAQSRLPAAEQLLEPVISTIQNQGYLTTCFQDLITIKAVGDMMLSRHVNTMMAQANDRELPFLKTADFISLSDLTFGNLESPFYDQGPVVTEGMTFKAEPENIAGLLLGGFDIVDLANNHFGNQGRSGMRFTFDYLPENGIQYYGAGRDYTEAHTARIMTVDGQRIGFLSYDEVPPESYSADDTTPGFAWEERTAVAEDIKAALPLTDFLIVSFHWGVEYTPHPTGVQQQFAHLAIDSGADMIISHHPHVVQATEWYDGKFIAYSLGNFVFDQMWSTETQQGIIASFSLAKNPDPANQRLVPLGIDLTPVRIANYNQPDFADQEEANEILERVFDASAQL